MIPILEENRQPTMSERFGKAFSNLGQGVAKEVPDFMVKSKEREATAKLLGEDMAYLPFELQHELVRGISRTKEGKAEQFKVGLDTLQQMRKLLEKGTIGTTFGVGLNPFRHMGEGGHDREQFAHYGRSLIPLVAAGVSVRNRNEFEEYKKIITNPDATPDQLAGAIDGLEHLFIQKAGGEDAPMEMKKEKVKFNPKNSSHKAKFEQLHKKFKGDKEKVNEALAREFE